MTVTQPTIRATSPTMLVTQATPTRLIPATMVHTTILATATVIAVRTTALIGARVVGLPAEFIGDTNAGSRRAVRFTPTSRMSGDIALAGAKSGGGSRILHARMDRRR